MKRLKITNWNNYPVLHSNLEEYAFVDDLAKFVQRSESFISRGNGRCYGDASLNENILSTLKLNNILSFDRINGIIHAQSGVLLREILELILPEGWFLPVTPGTKFITIGGAIASNVHGKNHHKEGSFGQHVTDIDLLDENGQINHLKSDSELFMLTCGGMGLTGVIVSATIKLKAVNSQWIDSATIKSRNLKETMTLFEEKSNSTYSMAWIDTLQKGKNLGRSILILGEHSNSGLKKIKKIKDISLPFYFPSWVLSQYSIKAFNFLYYNKQIRKHVKKHVHYDPFFYPLDSILKWNRMYGKRGFIQYQLVIPLKNSYQGLSEILSKIAKSKHQSFLSVLKLMGKEDNKISFPMEGYTLSLDFPIKKGLFDFLHELDSIVLKFEGRLYLSKDARMTSEFFVKSNPNWEFFRSKIKKYDRSNKFSSNLNSRLQIKS